MRLGVGHLGSLGTYHAYSVNKTSFHAACFGVEKNVDRRFKYEGGGTLFIPLVYAVHSQDDCQVVFENKLLSSLLFS